MIYIILGVGVVVVVAVTIMNRSDKKQDPAVNAAKRVRDSVHITDDGEHGSFEKSSKIEGGDYGDNKTEDPPETKEEQKSVIVDEEKMRKNGNSDLIWSGKGARLEVSGVSLPGPMTYWSNGPSHTKEPCCIDVTLPVKFDETIGQPEISGSYDTMSPEQRGAYLRWLSRGRMGAISPSYFRTWFFGIERRALVEKKDSPMCLGEISSRLPSLLENPALPVILRFMICSAVMMKYPTDKLALDLRCVSALPAEVLNVLLAPYAGSEIRVPPLLAYTVMRSAFPGNNSPILYNDEQMMLFTAAYSDIMDMGMSLVKPKAITFVAYFPTNPSLSGSKPLVSIETPDFFKDPSQFAPLLAVWEQVRNMRLNKPTPPPRKKRKLPNSAEITTGEGVEGQAEAVETEELPSTLDKEMRSDIDLFMEEKLDGEEEPLILPLLELSELIELEIGERPTGAQRRGLCEITRTGGRLLVPDLGIAGKTYQWEDLVCLVWIEIGERVSDHYRAAAILFEFAASLVDAMHGKKKMLPELVERITLHFDMSEKELERIKILSTIFEYQSLNPENLSESLKSWIQPEDRQLMRDFFYRLCTSGDATARARDELSGKLLTLLDVEGRPQPIANISPQEIGGRLTKALKRLFRSEELHGKGKKEAPRKEETKDE